MRHTLRPRPANGNARQRLQHASRMLLAGWFALAGWASAHAAGELVLVQGQVWVDRAGERLSGQRGTAVAALDAISTEAGATAYVRLQDGTLLVLRSGSRVLVSELQIPAPDGASTAAPRVRFTLVEGEARVRSGSALQKHPQGFRLNTPVAAVGIRGTDFTVLTSSTESFVAIREGAVVVDRLAEQCTANALGPCSGASAELLTPMQQRVLRVTQSGVSAQPLPPVTAAGPSLAAVAAELPSRDERSPAAATVRPPAQPAPAPEEPVQVAWGRLASVPGLPASPAPELPAGNQAFTTWPGWIVARELGGFSMPNTPATISFNLAGGEAWRTERNGQSPAAALEMAGGALAVSLADRRFNTTLDVRENGVATLLRSQGRVWPDGRITWEIAPGQPGSMWVTGWLAGQDASQAVYAFGFSPGGDTLLTGVARWRRAGP